MPGLFLGRKIHLACVREQPNQNRGWLRGAPARLHSFGRLRARGRCGCGFAAPFLPPRGSSVSGACSRRPEARIGQGMPKGRASRTSGLFDCRETSGNVVAPKGLGAETVRNAVV